MPRKVTIDVETARYFLTIEKALHTIASNEAYNLMAVTGHDANQREMYHSLMHNALDAAIAKPEYRPRKMTQHTRGIR